jgi:outer membrane receptor protein involved in Fe transport
MNHFPRSLIGAAVASILAAPTISLAQSADATLRGSAPPSADVTAKNVATGSTRRTKANAEGNYTLSGLSPGTYRVDAGAGTEQVVTLTVASTAYLDLTAGGAETSEAPMQEVTVTGRRLVEVRTSEIGATISQQQIESVPQMTRNFLEFADTVPGIVFQVDSKGATSLNAGAQGANSVNVYIDGVGQKGYVRAGVSGQNDGTQGNPFPQLAIGEYKVITSNYKAEYDQISSAAITAQTRSGTNEFEGQAFGTYSADNFRARTPAERDSGTKTPSESKEYGIAFGGPIMQDKMHFFATYEAKRYVQPVTVIPANANVTAAHLAQLPADVSALFGPASIEFEEDLFFVKVDYEPTDVDRFEFSAKLRKETLFGSGIGAGIAPSAAVDTDNDDDRFLLQWKHSGERWFNEVELTYEDAFFVPHVRNADQNGISYTFEEAPNNDQPIITLNGADPRAGQNKGQKGWSVGNTITFTDIGWGGGDHTIKAGIKYKQVELTAADAVQNNPVFSYHVTPTSLGATPWRAVFSLGVEGFSGTVTSDDKQLGLFVQDDWEVNDKLTLNLGVRYDLEWNPSYLDFETPQFLLDSLNTLVDTDNNGSPDTPYRDTLNASSDPNVAIDIDDYISTGDNREVYKGAFQPRLGFSYDFGGDQRHVLFGGAGRAYDRTLYDYLQLEQNKFALATTTVEFDLGGTDPAHDCDQVANFNCIAWDPAYLTDPSLLVAQFAGSVGETNIMNNDLKVPYSDQYSIGMRNRVGDWNTSASVSRIHSKDGFAFSLANRYPNGDFWQNGGQPWGNSPPGLAGVLLIGYNGLESESTQVALSAEKPFTAESKWGATVAYTYTDADMNNSDRYSFSESLVRAYSMIQSDKVARHRFVGTGTYELPWGMQIAGKFTWSSPIPSWFESCYTGGSGVFYPDGAACTPFVDNVGGTGYQALDLQFTKNFELGDMGSMYLRLDVLNVTNEDNLVDFLAEPNLPDGRRTGSRYNPTGNITGFPRTLRASFGVKF